MPDVKRQWTDQEKDQAKEKLLEKLAQGDTIYVILKHINTSKMKRWIDLYYIRENKTHWISRSAACVLDLPFDNERETLIVAGAGMDMGFAVVNDLSVRLYGQSLKLEHKWL